MFVASSLLGFFISWRLALVFLSPVPVLLLRALTLGEKIGNATEEARDLWNAAESVQHESLEKLDTVIAFGQQQQAIIE
jgi:ABC-type multidrug transport system fused ATPase/permease subunit